MAMTADSTSNHVTPRGSGFSGDGLSSPQLRRKNSPSQWSEVVRGEHDPASTAVNHSQSSPSPPPTATSLPEPTGGVSPSKAVASAPSSPPPDNPIAAGSSDADKGNAARPKKLAWNKPSNGVVEVGPVMGAASWPALSESTKPSPKSSSADSSSSKSVADGSVSGTQVPLIPHLPQKVSNANANPNSNANRTMPARQRLKRSGGGVSNAGSGPTQTRPTQPPPPPPPPPFPVFPMPPNSFANLVTAMPDPSPREPLYRGSNWDARPVGGFVSQSHPMNDQRNSSRRGNYGQRGDGNYNNNFGGRHDQDRGNYSNARDAHVQPQRGPPRGFVRPAPPNAAAFAPPQPMRPFPNPMGFPEFIYIPPMPVEAAALRGVTGMPPFIPPAPVLMPVPEPSLAAMLIHQIDYYFSDANLVKDEFLKSNMDDQGWVPITLIASFPRVSFYSQISYFLITCSQLSL
ncbi:La-related protein 1C [Citrus sinensis]|uniref:HTH La-type RNA-binding domain-containing protein n=1 Tax=Citrus clementina TaxID=85681 RepID=V4TA98_CITCL|nr:hypothetical protein CICLE_v10000767mg [Citrus x clementina]KAH9693500.1 La-related protein 1C [Citrus sinensis]